MRAFAICLLISSSALAQERPAAPAAGAHFFFGPALQLVYSGSSPSAALALQGILDTGQWMFGGELRLGGIRGPLAFFETSGRVDRFLGSGDNSFYLGAHFGWMDQADGENYGGQGPFTGAQAGLLFGRDRTWGRLAFELQVSVPLFGERPDKPGDYVYPFATLGLRLLL